MNAIVMVMLLILYILSVSAAADIAVHLWPVQARHARTGCAYAAAIIIAACGFIVFLTGITFWTIALGFVYAYQLCNIFRIIKGRMHERYLWHTTYRTSLVIIAVQYVILGTMYVHNAINPPSWQVLSGLLTAQLFVATIMLQTVRHHVRKMRAAGRLTDVRDSELPSLTVAIPARNETEELEACIRAVLASHYPKLEILVLDDCSQSTRTPEIIRSFAHDGVRFLAGTPPAENWLAKNQAYDALSQAASGELILFCGVDIRFDPGSLRQIVAYTIAKQKQMVCIMPTNELPMGHMPLIQPMRYLWELAIPRTLFGRPPVLSSCWLIQKSALKDSGGFEAAKRMVVPEAYFATRTAAGDGYSFLASGSTFGVHSYKTPADQRSTAIRVGYPSLHRRPEAILGLTAGYVGWQLLPLLSAVIFVIQNLYVLLVLPIACVAISVSMYGAVHRLAYGNAGVLRPLSFPLAAATYLGLINYSMYKYEFSEVTWKGRNVCLPVMHVVPSLPKV